MNKLFGNNLDSYKENMDKTHFSVIALPIKHKSDKTNQTFHVFIHEKTKQQITNLTKHLFRKEVAFADKSIKFYWSCNRKVF